jgi:two-component system CheB/CheR fusion protein
MTALHDPRPVTQLVAVGASAGGVEALMTLVGTLPANFPAPLVVALHHSPNRPSYLQAILGHYSVLPVRTIIDHAALAPGVIHVVPAGCNVTIDDHHFRLHWDGPRYPRPSIDLLFRSAAATFGDGLIAVVLTGLGSDGAAGARSVKDAGGTVVIQNPRTAPYPSMPEALSPGVVDQVADVKDLGPLLYELLATASEATARRQHHPYRAAPETQ